MTSWKYHTGRRISLKSLLHRNEHLHRIPRLKNRQNELFQVRGKVHIAAKYMQMCVLANQIAAFLFLQYLEYLIQQVIPFFCTFLLRIKIIVFWVAHIWWHNSCMRRLTSSCNMKTVPERPILQKLFKKLCLIMLMSLLKSTITKWHIFTPDFAHRGWKASSTKYGPIRKTRKLNYSSLRKNLGISGLRN